jgi:hypothetical protein
MKYLLSFLFLAMAMFATESYAQSCKKNAGVQVQEYLYDFAVDGGVKDANIVLSAKPGKKAIPVGAIIKGVTAKVLTAVSGSSSTVSWGISSNADAYSGTTIAEASLGAGVIVNGWRTANSTIWDDTNDVQIYLPVTDAASGSFVVLISTANLTAGKILFLVEYYCPSL